MKYLDYRTLSVIALLNTYFCVSAGMPQMPCFAGLILTDYNCYRDFWCSSKFPYSFKAHYCIPLWSDQLPINRVSRCESSSILYLWGSLIKSVVISKAFWSVKDLKINWYFCKIPLVQCYLLRFMSSKSRRRISHLMRRNKPLRSGR